MCGLAGVIDLNGRREPDRAQVERMGAALTHRGPDDVGTLFAPGIGLAYRSGSASSGSRTVSSRSSTRTAPSSSSATASCSTIRSARPSFEARGHVFRTGSDCELIVHLYEEHGEDLFPHLKGQFAFVLFDFASGSCSWRAIGSASARCSGRGRATQLYFGSEIKALLASGAVPAGRRRSRPRPPLHLLCARLAPHLFEGVQSILPGHYLRIAFNTRRPRGRPGRAALLGPRLSRLGR